jgi:hypothetical protein
VCIGDASCINHTHTHICTYTYTHTYTHTHSHTHTQGPTGEGLEKDTSEVAHYTSPYAVERGAIVDNKVCIVCVCVCRVHMLCPRFIRCVVCTNKHIRTHIHTHTHTYTHTQSFDGWNMQFLTDYAARM